MPAKKNIAGQKFGRLFVIEEAGRENGHVAWRCRCECGEVVVTPVGPLLDGRTKSCGCLKREHATIHDLWTHPLYDSWQSMLQRCYNPKDTSFAKYGGRGIRVCDRWRVGEGDGHPFELFVQDVGQRPTPSHTIDRYPNNNGPYEPGNVRWATKSEQSLNQRQRRDRRIIELDGRRMTIQEACALRGLERATVYKRLKQGQSLEDAFTVRRKSSKGRLRQS